MKPKLKKGAHWIDRAMMESPYCIGLCQTEAQFRHELKRLKVEQTTDWIIKGKDANVTELENLGGIKCFLVSIRATKTTQHIEVIGILIHEAVHVWQNIRDDIGEAKPSPEFEAYSIQNIAQKLIDAYLAKAKKSKRCNK